MNETPENSVPTPLQPPKKRRRVHRPASGPKIERAVAEMRAVGLSQKTSAVKLDISQQTVSQVLKRDHVQVDKWIRETPRASTRPCGAFTASSAFGPAW